MHLINKYRNHSYPCIIRIFSELIIYSIFQSHVQIEFLNFIAITADGNKIFSKLKSTWFVYGNWFLSIIIKKVHRIHSQWQSTNDGLQSQVLLCFKAMVKLFLYVGWIIWLFLQRNNGNALSRRLIILDPKTNIYSLIKSLFYPSNIYSANWKKC